MHDPGTNAQLRLHAHKTVRTYGEEIREVIMLKVAQPGVVVSDVNAHTGRLIANVHGGDGARARSGMMRPPNGQGAGIDPHLGRRPTVTSSSLVTPGPVRGRPRATSIDGITLRLWDGVQVDRRPYR